MTSGCLPGKSKLIRSCRRCTGILLIIIYFGIYGCNDSLNTNIVDPSDPEQILIKLNKEVPDLRNRLNDLEDAGIDVSYPLVRLTVLEQFSVFLEDDINDNESQSLIQQKADELLVILQQCDEELTALESGELNPSVPRYVTSSISIQNGAFQATVEWKDGSGKPNETWPVIFNGFGAFESVIRDIELMPDYGCHIIQIELGPNSILMSDTENDMSSVNELIAVLDRAEAANVSVNLLISPNYFPEWAFEQWPEIKKSTELDEYINFFVDEINTHARDIIERFLNLLIPEIKGHAALHSITLTNEPSYFNGIDNLESEADSFNRASYNAWLQAEYGGVSAVSQAHGESYASYDDVPIFYTTEEFSTLPADGSNIQKYDYYRFNDERFAGFHQWMAEIIHGIAPDLPVHTKITDQTWQEQREGVDPEAFVNISEIAGNDSAKYYTGNSDYYAESSEYLTQNILFDLLRSAGKGKPLFNSENHLIADDETNVIPSTHIRNVLWQAAVHGQAASVVWLWEQILYDEEAEENTRNSIMNRPDNVVEHGRTALDLLRLGKEINAFQTAPARVALIYSSTSLTYNQDYASLLYVAYEALNNTGEKIDFITETGLSQGDAADYDIVVVFEVSHLPAEAYNGLAANPPTENLILIGENNFKRDNLDRAYDFSLPQNSITLTDADDAYSIREGILPVLDQLSGGRPVKVKLSDSTDDEAFGVEWRSVLYNGDRLVNITNYNKQDVSIILEGISATDCVDLITNTEVDQVLIIDPLEIYLIRISE